MLKKDVKVGGTYDAKVSGKLVEVRILRENAHGGWDAINNSTRREIRVRSAQRLRSEVRASGREFGIAWLDKDGAKYATRYVIADDHAGAVLMACQMLSKDAKKNPGLFESGLFPRGFHIEEAR